MKSTMKHKIYAGLSLIIILIILPNVFALVEGDRLTQAQLDMIPVDTVSLQCQNEGITNDWNTHRVIVETSCLSIVKDKNLLQPYLIVRNKNEVFNQTYATIITDFLQLGLTKLKIVYRTELVNKFKEYRLEARNNIRRYQTNDISEIIADLNLTSGELN